VETTNRIAARATAAALILALAVSLVPAQDVPPPAKGSARFEGRVLRSDGKTPVETAVIRACYLEDGRSYSSNPTGPKGQFSIGELPSGYADVVVETPQGIFVVNQVLQFLPGEKEAAELVLTLYTERPAEWWGKQEKRQVPCASGESTGSADIRTQNGSSAAFLKSPAGITVLAAAGAALILLAVAGGDDDETSASPSQP
jgi:hypothetical protein